MTSKVLVLEHSLKFWNNLVVEFIINMSFRRIPFQFTATDPVERQRELERRFGLPTNQNMFVDVSNPLSAGAAHRETSSPRLQHRVPIFVEGYDQPIPSAVDSMGCTIENKKPNVRVIPIEVEGADIRPSSRHRTFSGPAGIPKEHSESSLSGKSTTTPLKHSMVDLSNTPKTKPTTGQRVHNIPIQIEGDINTDKNPKTDRVTKQKESPKINGCSVSKSFNNKVKSPDTQQKSEPKDQKIKKEKTGVESSLKKIKHVLEEFKIYEKGVEKFSGTTKDKQYRYLDEMLTRCMLRLDDIDTLGNENVRSARKNAVKEVQASVDLLERKANTSEVVATPAESEIKSSDVQETSGENANGGNHLQNKVGDENDVEMKENKDTFEGQDDNKQYANVEVTMSTNNISTNVNEVAMEEKPTESEVKVNGVPEVEMPEMQASLSKDLPPESEVKSKMEMTNSQVSSSNSTEVSEVEMADCSSDSEKNEENLSEITSVQASSDAVQSEVEMKDVQNTLNDNKESVVENIVPNSISQSADQGIACTSSQPVEQGVNSASSLFIEDETVMNDAKTSASETVEKSAL